MNGENQQQPQQPQQPGSGSVPAGGGAGPVAMSASEERNWAMFAHLSALSIYVGVPFGNILGPLILWLLKKDQSALVAREGKESLNFQISMLIYLVACIPLLLICVGGLLMGAIVVLDIVCVIIAAIKVSNGEHFEYPLTIRLIK